MECNLLYTVSSWLLGGGLLSQSPRVSGFSGVVTNSDPCQIITPPLELVGLGLGVGEGLGLGVGLGLGNQITISTRGVIIWQGVEPAFPAPYVCVYELYWVKTLLSEMSGLMVV